MPRRHLSTLAAAATIAVVLTGCADDPENSPSDATRTAEPDREPAGGSGSGAVEAADLATGLTTPWGLVAFDDGSVLLGERDTGAIKLLAADDPSTATEVTTIEESVPGGEAGLLGLAASPDEQTVFVYYTTESESRVVSMSWDGAALGEPRTIFEGIPGGAGFHQGGGLAVGPDELLYVSTGDNGVPDNAQDRDSLSGKVLRLTLQGEPAPDNPFGTAVYSYGHRNVEGITFDDEGRLWASEFGQNTYDELNLVESGGNYGWPEVEGTSDNADYLNPQVVWRTEDASPAGLTFWRGSVWMTALRGESLWEIPLDGAEADDPVRHLAGEHGRLRNVIVSATGDEMLLATSNTDGRGDPQDGDDRILTVTR